MRVGSFRCTATLGGSAGRLRPLHPIVVLRMLARHGTANYILQHSREVKRDTLSTLSRQTGGKFQEGYRASPFRRARAL